MDIPKRKHNRLPDYDYSAPGAYFITICTKNREDLFWNMRSAPGGNVGAATCRPPYETQIPACLTQVGEIVEKAIRNIPGIYSQVTLEKYVVMPDHVHLLLRIEGDENGRQVAAPTVNTIVGQMKRWVTGQIGRPVWQRSFYEHVIRNETDYRQVWEYIENNPAKRTQRSV